MSKNSLTSKKEVNIKTTNLFAGEFDGTEKAENPGIYSGIVIKDSTCKTINVQQIVYKTKTNRSISTLQASSTLNGFKEFEYQKIPPSQKTNGYSLIHIMYEMNKNINNIHINTKNIITYYI